MKIRIFLLFLFVTGFTYSQQTVGFQSISSGVSEGYTLFSPSSYTTTYLIDNCGREINHWASSYRPGQSAYLKENGNLVRTGNIGGIYFIGGGRGGIIEEYDWAGNLIWSFQHYNSQYSMHHDIEILPNGNILAIAWEKISTNDVIALGRDPSSLNSNFWSEKIIEIEPTYPQGGNIIWEWHASDHLIQDFDSTKLNFGNISDHPELLNINYFDTLLGKTDWLHFNSIRYNDSLDQILVSSRFLSEVYILDHSTTSAEAAGHSGGIYGKGGDILYRWGNPAAYNRGTYSDQILFQQHSAQWVPYNYPNENAIMVFNNGYRRPGTDYSAGELFIPTVNSNGFYTISDPLPYGPDSCIWSYTDTVTNFLYANIASGIQALPNGNFLISDGPAGRIFEVDNNRNVVWDYISPVTITGPVAQGTSIAGNVIFRADKYLPDFPGFAGHQLIPGDPVELSPLPYICEPTLSLFDNNKSYYNAFPNPAADLINIPYNNSNPPILLCIYDFSGRIIAAKNLTKSENPIKLDVSGFDPGLYYYIITLKYETNSGTFAVKEN